MAEHIYLDHSYSYSYFCMYRDEDIIRFQALHGQIIHNYVNGQLVDVEEIRKVIPGLKIKAG